MSLPSYIELIYANLLVRTVVAPSIHQLTSHHIHGDELFQDLHGDTEQLLRQGIPSVSSLYNQGCRNPALNPPPCPWKTADNCFKITPEKLLTNCPKCQILYTSVEFWNFMMKRRVSFKERFRIWKNWPERNVYPVQSGSIFSPVR